MCRLNLSVLLFAICIAAGGSLLTSPARSDDTDHLIQDIRDYLSHCKPDKTAPGFCAGLKAELLKRQGDLKLSNSDVNARLAQQDKNLEIVTRGGVHGRIWWP